MDFPLPAGVCGRRSNSHKVGLLKRINIVSNNACLFACFNLLLHDNTSTERDIRLLAADVIEADPDTFNDITLDKPRNAYLEWIRQDRSWGGYIELIALSRAYKTRIVVFDVDSGRSDDYGELNWDQLVFLMYDGLHYDAIVALDGCCPGKFVTLFSSTKDEALRSQVTAIIAEIRKTRQYNVRGQSLYCSVCGEGIADQNAATEHARLTGHIQFAERA